MTKKFKKNIFIVVAFIFFLLVGCETPTTATLPDLTGLSSASIEQILKQKKIKYIFTIMPRVYQSEDEYGQFIEYGNDLLTGDEIDLLQTIVIYMTALPLTFNNSSRATLDFVYENKSFLQDGIGEVTLLRNVDGDTAHFKDENGNTLKVRFLGIDTPEATSTVDPWGYAAASFTANILNNAKTIVLESEGTKMDTYGRYLAFVWVDGTLLNLELVNQAYSNSRLSSSSRFFELFIEADVAASKTGRRIYGEIDPNYNYA